MPLRQKIHNMRDLIKPYDEVLDLLISLDKHYDFLSQHTYLNLGGRRNQKKGKKNREKQRVKDNT